MNSSKTFIIALLTIVIIYIIGLPIDVMDVDAAQYASISSDMFKSGEYLKLYCRGYDYLDKPPFLFWVCQPFYFLFGVHDWSFKMGALMFILLGLYATFRLGKLLYNTKTAWFSVVILGSTQAWFLITNDVRTDGILASAIIYAVWQWKLFTLHKKWGNLIGASIGIAISMLTKGPIGLLVPALVIGTDAILNKNIRVLFSWKYLVGIIITAICLAPMLYGLYIQYDLEPGKTVSGGQVVNSGIRYYFWTQSFGRITGESVWDNKAPIYYFIPEMMWSFLPWSLFILQSIFKGFKTEFKKNLIPLAGFILPFIMMSLSKFKLSHYIFICYPFLALLVGKYLAEIKWNVFSKGLSIIFQLVSALAIVFLGYCFSVSPWIILSILMVMILLLVVNYIKKESSYFISIVIAAVGLNFFITGFIYYQLLSYQAAGQAGKEYVIQEPDKKAPFVEIGRWSYSTEFYAQTKVTSYASLENILNDEHKGNYWIYTDENNYQQLMNQDKKILFKKEFENYNVTRLKTEFIWPASRKNVLSTTYLVKVEL